MDSMSAHGSNAQQHGRLPTSVRPTHYHLTLRTDLESLTFRGWAVIDLNILEETKEVVFNSTDLEINDISVQVEAQKTAQFQACTEMLVDKVRERVHAKFENALPKGCKAVLSLKWEGKLQANMVAYYYSSTEVEGKKITYALTQFEATAARRAFPCWDEPVLKCEYTISMISRADTVNLSNMPAIEEKSFIDDDQLTGHWKITKFEKSPLMSTYLVAFANGHLDYLESSYTSPLSGKKIPLRIYATKDVLHQAAFSLDVKTKVMPIYEQVFQLEYPLPKLDTLVAHDFDAGAMENWGLITGRASAFLLDPKKPDLATKKDVAYTTSHECSHLWFGDLVTMEWWDNLWLKEGFATLVGEVIIVDKLFPEWKVDSEFIDTHLADALHLDAVRSSHPIEVPVPDVNQINQIFDALSYAKAGSVLRMLSNYVGEELFLQGVSKYLSNHLYGNTVTKDLWKGIGEASSQDIPSMLSDWIVKIGYPVITVKETSEGISLRQDRFLATGDPSEEENQTIWQIPLCIKSVDEAGRCKMDKGVLMREREVEIKLDTSRPFKLNGDTKGVFRVAYTPERLKTIAKEAAREGSLFSLEDRMGLVSDALVLSKAGISETSGVLDLFDALRNEREYLVWSALGNQICEVEFLLWEQPQEMRDSFDKFCRSLFKPLVDRLGYEYSTDDSPETVQLRTLAISTAAASMDQSVIDQLRTRFHHFQETGDDSQIPSDLLGTIYSVAVRHGGLVEYETAKKAFKNPPRPSVKIAAMAAMTATKDEKIFDEMMAFILTDVQLQDIPYFFSGAAANRDTRRKIGQFFKDNYDEIIKKYEGNYSLSYLIKDSFRYLTSEKDAQETEEFFKDKDVSKFNLALAQSLDSIRASAKWLGHSLRDIESWLGSWKSRQ